MTFCGEMKLCDYVAGGIRFTSVSRRTREMLATCSSATTKTRATHTATTALSRQFTDPTSGEITPRMRTAATRRPETPPPPPPFYTGASNPRLSRRSDRFRHRKISCRFEDVHAIDRHRKQS